MRNPYFLLRPTALVRRGYLPPVKRSRIQREYSDPGGIDWSCKIRKDTRRRATAAPGWPSSVSIQSSSQPRSLTPEEQARMDSIQAQKAALKAVSHNDKSAKKDTLKRKIAEVPKTDGKEDIEPEEDKTKKAKGLEQEIMFSIGDVKSHYKGAKLLPKWKAFQTTIYLEWDEGLLDSKKIAAFDFDGCLAKTNVKRVGANAWSLMYPSIPEKLQSLYNDGYKLVIFTNESNIERWKNKRQTAVDSKIGRLAGFIKLAKVPIQVFIACGFNASTIDPYRKPNIGMWSLLKNHFNSGLPIDMDKSFYVGDAAGREKDHSDADIKFAQAIGLKFYVPEEFFSV
ncbi:unnamed protein product [Cuscuta campestris]|uniref:Uncharacterized protein n=1 Tax=Cuscuta campestris TaxID=132261 RepID=A0A484M5J4_9ASTE|nr:unnamed protein product [Cuscuta campestris]